MNKRMYSVFLTAITLGVGCLAVRADGGAVPAAGKGLGDAAAELASKVEADIEKITLGATFEVSASYDSSEEDDFDVNVDTAEIDLGVDVAEGLTLTANLLWEEGEHIKFDVFEAEWAIPGLEGLSLDGGWLYLPFGVFETAMISDPMTLDLGEISTGAVGLKYGNDYFGASAYVFGGDVDTDQDEPRFAGALSFTPMGDETVTLTVAGISDIGECGMVDDINDALAVKDEETGEECEGTYDGAPGIDASLVVKLESIGVTLAMEYLAAVDDIELNGEKSQPQAWSADLAYTIFDRLTLASRYEGAEDFEFDWRAGVAAEYAINDHLAFSLEYLYGEPNDDEEDEEHLVTAKMAVTF